MSFAMAMLVAMSMVAIGLLPTEDKDVFGTIVTSATLMLMMAMRIAMTALAMATLAMMMLPALPFLDLCVCLLYTSDAADE